MTMIALSRAALPSLRGPLLLATMAAAFLACSSGDHPAPADDVTGEAFVGEVAGDLSLAQACTPRASRTCRHYYRDPSGQWHCPASEQLCKLDGTGWTPCGAFMLDPSGNVVPR